MNQLDLFDHPILGGAPLRPKAFARRADPETSKSAAAAVEPALPRLQTLVLEALRRHPAGLTTHEIADDLGLDLVTVSPRLKPMLERGLVVTDGKRIPPGCTRPSIIWRSTQCLTS